jgi:hypothetical protein
VWGLSIDRTGSVLRAATIAGLFEYHLLGYSPPATVSVIEYYHAGFGHYFITANTDEIARLDDGSIAGWTRTGAAVRWRRYGRPEVVVTAGTPVSRDSTEASSSPCS